MVSAILLHYVIDDPLPTRGTFGDPGTNSGADNFFLLALNVFIFSYMLSSFSTCSYYLNCFSTWYVWLLLEKKKKKKILTAGICNAHEHNVTFELKILSYGLCDVPALWISEVSESESNGPD